jgi:hypothetical protein
MATHAPTLAVPRLPYLNELKLFSKKIAANATTAASVSSSSSSSSSSQRFQTLTAWLLLSWATLVQVAVVLVLAVATWTYLSREETRAQWTAWSERALRRLYISKGKDNRETLCTMV